MKIETKAIREGGHIGDVVWVCHYNRPDLNKKPLRNVPPTKVIVTGNCELPKNKTVYYSETHFIALSKNGSRTKKVISPVDNTGFRSIPGNELFVFTDEDECNSEWNRQLEEHRVRVDVMIDSAKQRWVNERAELTAAMK